MPDPRGHVIRYSHFGRMISLPARRIKLLYSVISVDSESIERLRGLFYPYRPVAVSSGGGSAILMEYHFAWSAETKNINRCRIVFVLVTNVTEICFISDCAFYILSAMLQLLTTNVCLFLQQFHWFCLLTAKSEFLMRHFFAHFLITIFIIWLLTIDSYRRVCRNTHKQVYGNLYIDTHIQYR